MNRRTAELYVDEACAKQANPLIFGHFIEFMRDCIDEGMWAQLLKNRGFDVRKEIPDGVVDGNPNVAAQWYRTGYKNSFEITLDAEHSLAGDGYAQKITCFNDYGGYVGVAQNRLYLQAGTYRGYVWAKAEQTADIRVCMQEEEGRIYHQEDFTVDAGWKKYEFLFPVEEKTLNGIFEIRLLGEGTVLLDGASLMPERTVDGIWEETYEHIRALHPPVIRFPGGCFADCYHWQDGIGERDERPCRMNRHWGGFEDNSFGTDEYMQFCQNVGCEPMICVNFGSGTPQEAAAWVEYCNGGTDTLYGRLRAQNGHPEPYHIRYWDIGNETFGDWEIGHCSAEEYAEKYLEFYRAMKEKDESIVLMVCGGDGDDRSQEWNRQIAQSIGDKMDVVCLHMYAQKSMEGKRHDNRQVYYATVGAVRKYEEILAASYETVREGNPKVRLAVTEYNLGTLIDSYREQTLEAALFNAGMLNMFLRNTQMLAMCNISDLVNGWPGGCIVSKNGTAFGTASYYVMKLYAESGVTKVLSSSLVCETYDTAEQIGNIEPLGQVPYGDVTVCKDAQGRTVLFALNRCLEEEMCIQTGFQGTPVEITELTAPHTSDMNRAGEMIILPVTRTEKLTDGRIVLPPHSVSRIVCEDV